MDADRFDRLARNVTSARSRRGALRLLSGGVLAGALVSTLAPDATAGKAKKRCRRKGGVYLKAGGQCRCAYKVGSDETRFVCGANPNCRCFAAVAGTGFCSEGIPAESGCTTNGDCTNGRTCVVLLGALFTGGSCTTSLQCGALHKCINGTCRATACTTACPPPP